MLKFIFYKFSNWGKIRCYGSCKLDITYWTDSLIFRRKKVAVFNDNAEKKVIIMQKIFVNVNLVVFCSVLFCSVLFCSVLFLFRFVSSTLPVRRWTTRQKKKKLIRSRWRRRWRRKKMMMTKKKQTNVKMFWKKFSKFFPALLSQSFSTSYWKSGFFFFCFFSPLNFLSLPITYVFAWNNEKKRTRRWTICCQQSYTTDFLPITYHCYSYIDYQLIVVLVPLQSVHLIFFSVYVFLQILSNSFVVIKKFCIR